ncbi:APC family permease [Paraburkholderia bannensis]|uniref:APC family permease n=1 Tax=Paraburkholderia bannensis TaxID=765414 RepID=UPI002ABE74BC|nr:APC family permease [Paraburkholderia bannensis]
MNHPHPAPHEDDDLAQLKALGYTSNFDRSMSIWENFSLGFTYLSPVVGVYTVFQFAFSAGGPPMFWTYLLVGLGQLLVALVFGEIVSQFPIAGGLYPWARRLVGKRWAWMAGWVYLWALFSTVAAVAVGGAPYLVQLLGLPPNHTLEIFVAVAMIAVTTILNLSGTRLLARVAMFGFICELIGAVAVGAYLLFFARLHNLSFLFDTMHLGNGTSYLPAFLASSVAAMFAYYGFEACGDVAEETPDPGRAIPKAMRMTIYIGGAAAMLVCLALVLALPDPQAAISGKDADPVASTLRHALGEGGFRAVIAVVLVSFFSCLLSLQAATSRLIFAYSRDEMIFASRHLAVLSPKTHVPTRALFVAGVIPALVALLGIFLDDAVKTIIVFGSAGIYIAFQSIVLAALIARVRGWKPAGKFRLGAWAWPVNLAAFAYGVSAIVNMMWPRSPDDPWYLNYGMIFTTALVLAAGLAYMIIGRPYERGTAAAGDAHLLHLKNPRAHAALDQEDAQRATRSQLQN